MLPNNLPLRALRTLLQDAEENRAKAWQAYEWGRANLPAGHPVRSFLANTHHDWVCMEGKFRGEVEMQELEGSLVRGEVA